MVECWKRNKYAFPDLEEMFLINMQQNQDKELLARELRSTLRDDGCSSFYSQRIKKFSYQCRESLPEGVSCERLVNLTIEFLTNDPSMADKLFKYRKNLSPTEQVWNTFLGSFGKWFSFLSRGKEL